MSGRQPNARPPKRKNVRLRALSNTPQIKPVHDPALQNVDTGRYKQQALAFNPKAPLQRSRRPELVKRYGDKPSAPPKQDSKGGQLGTRPAGRVVIRPLTARTRQRRNSFGSDPVVTRPDRVVVAQDVKRLIARPQTAFSKPESGDKPEQPHRRSVKPLDASVRIRLTKLVPKVADKLPPEVAADSEGDGENPGDGGPQQDSDRSPSQVIRPPQRPRTAKDKPNPESDKGENEASEHQSNKPPGPIKFRLTRLRTSIQFQIAPDELTQQVNELNKDPEEGKPEQQDSNTKVRKIPKVKTRKPKGQPTVTVTQQVPTKAGEEIFQEDAAGETLLVGRFDYKEDKLTYVTHRRQEHEALSGQVERMLDDLPKDYVKKSDQEVVSELNKLWRKQLSVAADAEVNVKFAYNDLRKAQAQVEDEARTNHQLGLKLRFWQRFGTSANVAKWKESTAKLDKLKAQLKDKERVADEAEELVNEADMRLNFIAHRADALKTNPFRTQQMKEKFQEELSGRAYLRARLDAQPKQVDVVSRRRIIWKLKNFVTESAVNAILNEAGGFRSPKDQFTKADIRRLFPAGVHKSVIDAIFTVNLMPIQPNDPDRPVNAMTRMLEQADKMRKG